VFPGVLARVDACFCNSSAEMEDLGVKCLLAPTVDGLRVPPLFCVFALSSGLESILSVSHARSSADERTGADLSNSLRHPRVSARASFRTSISPYRVPGARCAARPAGYLARMSMYLLCKHSGVPRSGEYPWHGEAEPLNDQEELFLACAHAYRHGPSTPS